MADPEPIRVLVAEDEDEMRQMLTDELRDAGYEIMAVENRRQLLAWISEPISKPWCPKPDLVISDIKMPGFSALDVLAALRKSDWAMPVILITAFGDQETHEEAMRLGAARVFDKPFDLDDLIDTARNMVPPSL